MTKRISLAAYVLISISISILVSCHDANALVYSSISGKVIAEDTGEGLAGVTVEAFLAGESGEDDGDYHYSSTDARGVYVLKDLRPGTYLIGFHKENDIYLIEQPHVEVVLPIGKHVVNANLMLTLGGSVSGTVYQSDGTTPMAGVGVYASVADIEQDWIDNSKYRATGIDGKYLLQGLPQSDNCTIEIMVPGHAYVTKPVKVTKGATTNNIDFTIIWDDITGINGYVRSSIDSNPIKNARVELTDVSGNDVGHMRTDESGKYSIVGVVPGIYEATAFWPEGDDWIDRTGILVESGKSTLVNFDFDKIAPVAENTHMIWNGFLAFFISDVFAQGNGGGNQYPDPKVVSCSKNRAKKIKAAYEKARDRIIRNNPRCFSGLGDTRDNLLKKLKEKITIKCVSSTFRNCKKKHKDGKYTCAAGRTPGTQIYICPRFFTKNCTCSEAILLHELIHNTGVEGEEAPEGCERACFECARPDKDCEYPQCR